MYGIAPEDPTDILIANRWLEQPSQVINHETHGNLKFGFSWVIFVLVFYIHLV
ncbi:hypothetical protein HBE96_21745 [Clostridium sp. P21]|uniref:Uncharacterized protein n=1 Tax=Clostridium muellerianum TaxID=2716538 RepID=A0A7Y0EKM8_9CLOT|nr:hypothetical protein [Clostridium muellerianum]NMM65210.1 hypothetical protein [Clostridium muellerianum]